jgi:serine/threonine protein kinase
MDPLTPDLPAVTQLGEFRIESVLGEGGSGTVYAAHWGHREVALKVLRDAWLPSDSERRRFLDEARLLADVNHPGVVRILGFGELPDGRPYLAMERLEGESLANRLNQGALEVGSALALFEQLCQAVHTLHERGLIHRDIKPENVFLIRQEQYAVLLDFGIAKPMDAPDSTVTREGGVRGTPAYMAPERFFGAPANTATDIYELGVVLYTMVTGRLPWEGASDPVTRLNPLRPSDLGISLPGALEVALLEALASRAEGRPSTVADLAARVSQAVHTTPSTGGPRRTADLSTADARMTSPGKGRPQGPGHTQVQSADHTRARLAVAPTLQVTPERITPSPPPIASYWSDSNPSIVVADLRATGPGDVASPGLDANSNVITASTLGVGLPTPNSSTRTVTPPGWGRLPAILGGGLLLVLLAVGTTYLLTRPGKEQPLSVGATGLVRPPDQPVAGAVVPPRRLIPPGRDGLIWRIHPRDTQLLVRLSHDRLRQSEVFKALLHKSQTPIQIQHLAVLKKACGMDLLERAEWLSVGLVTAGKDTLVDFMLRSSWTRDEVEGCVTKLGKTAGIPSTVQRHGQTTRVELGGSIFWIGWPNSKTLFLSNRDAADQQWVLDRLAGKKSARESGALRRLFDRVNPSTTAWAVINSDSFIDDKLLGKIPKPAAAQVNLWVEKDLKLEVTARYTSAKAALRARDGLRIKLHKITSNVFVNSMITRAEITGTGNFARFIIHMDQANALIFANAVSSMVDSADLSSVTPKP